MKKLPVLCLLAVLCGCNTASITDQRVTFTARMVAWPWQDSQRTIEKLTVSARGTNFNFSLRGLSEQETTSTNLSSLIESVAAGVARGVRQ
jgi:hypothetical protein